MELLTIAKFAEKAGVTPQAVYKRLSTDLAPYLVVENGVKLLKEEALVLYRDKQQVSKTSREAQLELEVERLKLELETERQISKELQTQLNEQTKKIEAQSAKLLDILDRQTTQFQLLLAHQQTTTQQVLNATNPLNQQNQPTETLQPVEKPVEKPSFFKKLFKRP